MVRSLILLMVISLMMVITACSPSSSSPEITLTFEELPAGDITRGEQLYIESINRAPTCISCHVLEGSNRATPSLIGYRLVAGERVEGMSAEEYSFWSIVDVGRHITPGYANVMYHTYADKLSAQEIADLIAYILSL
jgi:cytochrome c553